MIVLSGPTDLLFLLFWFFKHILSQGYVLLNYTFLTVF